MAHIFIEDASSNVMILEKQPRRKKGVLLSATDIFILKQIYSHKIVSSRNVHKMYQFFEPQRSSQSITNRITRLVKSNILIRRESYVTRRQWSAQHFYTLATRGYHVLEKTGYLPAGSSEKHLDTVRVPSEHNELAIELMIDFTLRFYNDLDAGSSIRGNVHRLFDSTKLATPLVPDYVIEIEHVKQLFFVEFDTGTEQLHRLIHKTERYIKLQKEGRFEDLQPFIIFVIRSNEGTTPQFKRIQNIKAAHSPFHKELHDLPVYVVSDKDFFELMNRFIQKQYPISKYVTSIVNTDVSMFYKQKYRLLNGWDSERATLDKIVTNGEAAARGLYPNCAVLKFFNYRATLKTQVYITQELGSVGDYFLMANLLAEFDVTKSTLFVQEYMPLELIVTFPYISTNVVSTQRIGIQPTIKVVLQSELELLEALERIEKHEDESSIESKYAIQHYNVERAFSISSKNG